ncbi:MAG: amino acid ABC transporter permease [Erysipelotrichaceae bacterium]|nr:amino acid ABC transporter permease [Erysipelotrichaceae bacterium]
MEIISSVFTPGNVRYFLTGLEATLQFAMLSILFSFVLGTVLALVINYAPKLLGYPAMLFVELYRNTPLLLWVLFGRFGVAKAFRLDSYMAVLVMFVFFFGAIVCETMRSGLNAINKGQFEAAASQGFSFAGMLRYILVPQAIKLVMPQLLSTLITIIKDTSFLSVISIAELMYQGRAVMAQYVSVSEKIVCYGIIIAIYFTINFSLSLLVRHLSNKQKSRKPVGTSLKLG